MWYAVMTTAAGDGSGPCNLFTSTYNFILKLTKIFLLIHFIGMLIFDDHKKFTECPHLRNDLYNKCFLIFI